MNFTKILEAIKDAKYGKYASSIQPAMEVYNKLPKEERKNYLKTAAMAPIYALPAMLPISGPASVAFGAAYGLPIISAYVVNKQTNLKNKTEKVVKDLNPAGPIEFDGITYAPYAYINTKGDTIRGAGATNGKEGKLYEIEYKTPKDTKRDDSILTTKQESGNWLAGKKLRMNRTSDWGKTLDSTFFLPLMLTEITEDYSKKPWYSKWLLNLIGYKQGGSIDWLSKVPEEKCGGKVKKSLGGSKMKDISAAVEACGGKMKKKK